MLPGPRLFRNRWSALFWAGGIVWLAYDVAGSTPEPAGNSAAAATAATDATGEAVTPEDLAALANAMGN